MKTYTFLEKLKVCWYILRGKQGVPKKFNMTYTSHFKLDKQRDWRFITTTLAVDILGNTVAEKTNLFVSGTGKKEKSHSYKGQISDIRVYDGIDEHINFTFNT